MYNFNADLSFQLLGHELYNFSQIRRAVFGISVVRKDGADKGMFGTGFVIGRQKNRLIAATAVHVLAGIRTPIRGPDFNNRFPHLGPDDEDLVTNHDDWMLASFVVNGQGRFLRITGMRFRNHDFALLTLEQDDQIGPMADLNSIPTIGLDFERAIGPVVSLHGVLHDSDSIQVEGRFEDGRVGSAQARLWRSGHVRDIVMSPADRLGRVMPPAFSSTLDIAFGMSGSPIFSMPSLLAYGAAQFPEFYACGVASVACEGEPVSWCTHSLAVLQMDLHDSEKMVCEMMRDGEIDYVNIDLTTWYCDWPRR